MLHSIQSENQILVIFGSNGDLARRKLIPALFRLFCNNLLPQKFAIIGAGSMSNSDDTYRQDVENMLKEFGNTVACINTKASEFLKLINYQTVNNKVLADFGELKNKIQRISQALEIPQNVLFYYSIPPIMYEQVSENLAAHQLTEETNGWKRVIIEKPFGYSYDTAVKLDEKLHSCFQENQIYRIDHYLGKETVQNITVTRFANVFFEPLWNNQYVERVEIKSFEKIGVGNRGGYYDTAGALRDMIQNHLLQILAVVTMEPPVSFDPEAIQAEKAKVFKAIRPIKEAEVRNSVIRAQYKETKLDGVSQKGYLQEEGVAPNSKTETYCALKLYIDNERWQNVPFYLITGKQMSERYTEVVLYLKPAPFQFFKERCVDQSTNIIVLRIQPDESVSISFGMKKPGIGYKVQSVNLEFKYADLAHEVLPEAYERLLLDCMMGDSTLYPRTDALKLSWKFIDPILNAFKNQLDFPMFSYECGTDGPLETYSLYGKRLIEVNPLIHNK